jgi:hypothetical protein
VGFACERVGRCSCRSIFLGSAPREILGVVFEIPQHGDIDAMLIAAKSFTNVMKSR